MLSLYDWFILYFLCCFIIIFLCSGFLVLAKTQQKYKKKKYELLYIESVLLPFYHTKLCFSFFLSFSRIICFLALLCLLADFKRNSFLLFFFFSLLVFLSSLLRTVTLYILDSLAYLIGQKTYWKLNVSSLDYSRNLFFEIIQSFCCL